MSSATTYQIPVVFFLNETYVHGQISTSTLYGKSTLCVESKYLLSGLFSSKIRSSGNQLLPITLTLMDETTFFYITFFLMVL